MIDAERRAALEAIAAEVASARAAGSTSPHEGRAGRGRPRRPRSCSSARARACNEDREGRPFVGRAGGLLVEPAPAHRLAARGRLHHQRRQVPPARQPRPRARRDRRLRAVPRAPARGARPGGRGHPRPLLDGHVHARRRGSRRPTARPASPTRRPARATRRSSRCTTRRRPCAHRPSSATSYEDMAAHPGRADRCPRAARRAGPRGPGRRRSATAATATTIHGRRCDAGPDLARRAAREPTDSVSSDPPHRTRHDQRTNHQPGSQRQRRPAAPHHPARRGGRDRQEHVRLRVRRRHRRHRLRPDVPRRGDVRHRPRHPRRHLSQGAPRQGQGVPHHPRPRGPRRRPAVRPARVPGRAGLRLDPGPRPAGQQDQGAQAPQQPAHRARAGRRARHRRRSTSMPFRIGHSIPDAMGIALRTPVGTIVHTGDFKFDHTPVDGKLSDFAILAKLGAGGRRCACCPTRRAPRTRATRRPSARSARRSARSWRRSRAGSSSPPSPATSPASSRSSTRPRHEPQRRRSSAARWSRTSGSPPTSATSSTTRRGSCPRTRSRTIPDAKLVIATTGAQGEPMAGLARMANRDHRFVEIQPGDTVIVSASPIPGNEEYVVADDRQPVQGRRERLLPHDQARPRLRARQPGRAEADAQPDQAEALHPDPRRVPDAGPARPPGGRDRRRAREHLHHRERQADRVLRRRLRAARHAGRRPATSTSTACRWARSATSSCATGAPSPTTACSWSWSPSTSRPARSSAGPRS